MAQRPRRWQILRPPVAVSVSMMLMAIFAVAASPGSATTPDAQPFGGGEVAVEQQVVSELAAEGTTTFWVSFGDKADLSAARGISDWAERGQFVYDRLTQTARASQAELIALLEATGTPYESFWIANTIKVTGDMALLNEIIGMPGIAGITADRVHVVPDVRLAEGGNGVSSVEWNVDRIGAPASPAKAPWWVPSTPGCSSTVRRS